MSARSVRLEYPPSLLGRPVIQDLVRRFDLAVNILQAQISMEEGWIEVHLTGEESEIARAVEWLAVQGLRVEPMP
ncbi:MAG: NIL domain-containing protein [Anaerolineales bacterium]